MPDGNFVQPVLTSLDETCLTRRERFVTEFLALEWYDHLLCFKHFTDASDNYGHTGCQRGIDRWVNPIRGGKANPGQGKSLLNRTAGRKRNRPGGAVGSHIGSKFGLLNLGSAG